MLRSERIFSIFILLISTVCLYASTKLNIFHRGGEIGPGFLPLVLSSLLILLSIIYFFKVFIISNRAKTIKKLITKNKTQSHTWFILTLVSCLFMTPFLGMLVSLGVFSFVVLLIIEKVVWYRSAIFSGLLIFGIYLIFAFFLEMKIPTGIWF